MATKRLIRVPDKEEEPPPPEESWREWIIGDYLRYWYWVFFLFMDVMTFLWLWSSGIIIAVPAIFFIAAVLIEFYVYSKLWGPGGRLGPPPIE